MWAEVKNEAMTGKKTKGIKRHIVTDTMGNLLAIHVHAAYIHDTKGGVYTFEKALFRYPSIIGVCADGAYRKHFRRTFTEFYDKKVEIAQKLTPDFQVIPNRWKAERTFGWANFSRRLSKDYERTVLLLKQCSSFLMLILS